MIAFPRRLKNLIDRSQCGGAVRLAYEQVLPLLGNTNTGLYFFPEYTDHGPAHVEGVLASAAALVTGQAWPKLSPEDGVVLALAVLLHDAAMALTPDGFLQLVTTEDYPRLDGLDSRSWPDLFDEFYADARRWDGQKLQRVLGDLAGSDGHLIGDVVHVSERLKPEGWTTRYRKFLGEFVRTHHARIAHEMAVFGMPGPDPSRVDVLAGLPDELRELSGFVARSHNVSLRSTYPHLDRQYHGHIECGGTHPVFLMVLLRIADYLQLDATRVNQGWRAVQRLRSPISAEEWSAHLAVKEVREDDDPESLFVRAIPESAASYLKVKRNIESLQGELDTSWAVLSEVYGRRPSLTALQITVRRVRSSVDDESAFVANHSPSYYPLAAKYDTAGAALLKLLIQPLYGDRPDVGVRELLQNSLDAVRELARLREIHPELCAVPTLEQDADVLISIEEGDDGHQYLTVSDKGVGMTAETIRDYFLVAGASYRTSDAWRKDFESGSHSTVLRSGRFGVGALAALLLGDRLAVRTRSVWAAEDNGVCFEAGLDDATVELRRCQVEPVGTAITVRLRPEAAARLIAGADGDARRVRRGEAPSWDWYVLEWPSVQRVVHGQLLSQQLVLPCGSQTGPAGDWRSFECPPYALIQWNYELNWVDDPLLWADLVCNGIRVEQTDDERLFDYEWGPDVGPMPFRVPVVAVSDADGDLPLNLQRSALQDRHFPFALQLAQDVAMDYCGMLLRHAPTSTAEANAVADVLPADCGSFDHRYMNVGVCVAIGGIIPFHPWHLGTVGLNRIVLSWLDGERTVSVDSVLQGQTGFAYALLSEPFDDVLRWVPHRGRVELGPYLPLGLGVIAWRAAFMAPADRRSEPRGRDEGWNWDSLVRDPPPNITVVEDATSDALYVWAGESASDGLDMRELAINAKARRAVDVVVELDLDPSVLRHDTSFFSLVWQAVMGQAVIPFDASARRREFAGAYEALADHLALWEHPPPGGWREQLVSWLEDS